MYIFRHMTSTEELSVYLLIRKDLVLNLADKTGIDVTLYAVDIGVRGFLPQLGRLHHEMAIVTEAGHRGHGNGQIDGGEPQEANSHEKKDKIPHANTYRRPLSSYIRRTRGHQRNILVEPLIHRLLLNNLLEGIRLP